ncbi:MAG: MBL fold metallo-hydrolase [Candidatus Nanohaloarchaea archaeon]|nr:MBL fold metallo-hydrolase [Candidatus Nanohaloarchaea archaeon]
MQIDNLADDAESFTSNAFLIDDQALIDTGADPVILERLQNSDLQTVVITHSHHDHIENLPQIVEAHSPDVHAFEPDNLPVDAERGGDGDKIELAGTTFTAHHTPGHRDDHICLHDPDSGVLFAGDLLFPGGSFGRTDLEQGDRDTLIASIERIAGLDVTAMYAGHDQPTTEDVDQQIQDSLAEARKHKPKY